jgi:hypothetical protein
VGEVVARQDEGLGGVVGLAEVETEDLVLGGDFDEAAERVPGLEAEGCRPLLDFLGLVLLVVLEDRVAEGDGQGEGLGAEVEAGAEGAGVGVGGGQEGAGEEDVELPWSP